MKIRRINRKSSEEIELVAKRMQLTLIDVMGKEKGENYYSESWLLERVQFYIDLEENAAIFLAEENKTIIGQAIVRVEKDRDVSDTKFGYFSTIYVMPEYRRKGFAKKLIKEVHSWCLVKDLRLVTYSTAKEHSGLINLLKEFNYKVMLETNEMIRLSCKL